MKIKRGCCIVKPMKVKRMAEEAKWSSRNGGQAGRMKKVQKIIIADRRDRTWPLSKNTHWTKAIKHTVPVRDCPVLPRSQLSHRGAGNLSCPITEDTAVKLSNKSVSEGGRAPPADCVAASKSLRLLLSCHGYNQGSVTPRRSDHRGTGEVVQTDRWWVAQWLHAGEGKAAFSEQRDFFRPKYLWRNQYKLDSVVSFIQVEMRHLKQSMLFSLKCI